MFKMRVVRNKKFKIPKLEEQIIIELYGQQGLQDIYKAAKQDKERLLKLGAKEFIKFEVAFLEMYSKLGAALEKRLKERKDKTIEI